MILLDTNIIYELIKAAPDQNVATWADAQPRASLFVSTITEAELRYGVSLLAPGRRRVNLARAIEEMLAEDFVDRILSFDRAAAVDYAVIASGRRRLGRPIAQFDAQIAAIAKSRGAALATRNEIDFEDCGIKVLNPWTVLA